MEWLKKLNTLKEEHPDADIKFLVESDIIRDDGMNYWFAQRCSVSLEEVMDGGSKLAFDIELDDEIDYLKDEVGKELLSEMLFNAYGHHIENEYERMIDSMPWKKTIVVKVTT